MSREIEIDEGVRTVIDKDDVVLPNRKKIQFKNCTVTDDEANDTTIVEMGVT